MAFGDGTLDNFRSRAASLLHPSASAPNQPQIQGTDLERVSTGPLIQHLEHPLNEKSLSLGQPPHTSIDHAIARDRAAQCLVRTIPPWVQILDMESEDVGPHTNLLPFNPPSAQIAQHNNSPSKKNYNLEPFRGRLPDLENGGAFPDVALSRPMSKWRAFAESSAYPVVSANGGEHVTEDWMVENGADYSRPWLAGDGEDDAEKSGAQFFMSRAKRKGWWHRMQRLVIRSPMVPLALRSIVWFFSAVALALGSSIHNLTSNGQHGSTPSTNMAIIVDAIALVYILYITYDEYTGKPLGLRSARAKMRLIFLDLFFIVFDSANLSLTFEAISDNGLHGICPTRTKICRQQRTLASVLLIALIAWLLTFSISVLRLVERVTHK